MIKWKDVAASSYKHQRSGRTCNLLLNMSRAEQRTNYPVNSMYECIREILEINLMYDV
jgi:hypothetical protein